VPTQSQVRNPWFFVPLLYFMQAIPVSLVQDVSSVIYKDFGIANEPITRWTSLIALPWSLQLLLGPLVDLTSTKRAWVMRCQAIMTGVFAIVPFLLRLPHAFELSLCAFFIAAIFSSLCNTAMDGFYLATMPRNEQAKFAGVQTTCYRLGTMFCKGFLVYLAGRLARGTGMDQTLAWSVVLLIGAAVFALGFLFEQPLVPKPESDAPVMGTGEELGLNLRRTGLVTLLALSGYFCVSGIWKAAASSIATVTGSLPGWTLKSPSSILGVDLGLPPLGTELLQAAVCGVITAAAFVAARRSIVGSPMGEAFGSYFRQSKIVPILAFLMFYRFGEAMVGKMSLLFLKDTVANGGMGLSNEDVGTIKGVVGVLGIVLGGLLGGWIVSKFGLRKSFWPIAICMHLPNLLYLWAASVHPAAWTMFGVDFTEQFGYGFGFAGYLIFQMQVAQRGAFRTAHYALGVGIGALFIQLAGILSGVLQASLGYQGFFIAVMFLTLPGLITLFFIPLEESGGTPVST
jgi:PAT family beta-lactamase induction signal transducer AmpG